MEWAAGHHLLSGGWITVTVFVAVLIAELWRQPVSHAAHTGQRWRANLGLFAIEQVVTFAAAGLLASYIAILSAASPVAQWTASLGWGVRLCIAVIALDAVSYAIHVASHHVALLWRLHAVHHSDPALDATTAVRHHPLEAIPIVLGLGLCAGMIGTSLIEFGVFGSLAFLVQMLAHADLRLPTAPMRWWGLVFVTPEQHALHHSRRLPETNSNYGQVFSFWDRMFGSLRYRDAGLSTSIDFGLDTYPPDRHRGLVGALMQPVARPGGSA